MALPDTRRLAAVCATGKGLAAIQAEMTTIVAEWSPALTFVA